MNRELFLFLLRCLRFDDFPTKHLTVDENIIPFKGRCSFKQYLPYKPAKYGIKTYVLCCSCTSYVVNLEIYAGKQHEGPYQISNSPNNVVERLVLPIFGYPLAVALLNDHKLTFAGTLKNNKKEIPPEFMPNRAQVFSSIFGLKKKMSPLYHMFLKGAKVSFFYLQCTQQQQLMKRQMKRRSQKLLLFTTLQKEGWTYWIKRRHSIPWDDVPKDGPCYHHIRSTTKSFSKPIRSIVRKHTGQSPETMEEDISEPLSKAQKRCHLCSYKKDRKTKTLCQKCQKNVCKEHSIIICRQCM
ncbi:hypothetical protein LAZ67_15001134 [Cordylochernes scorpioides]|uniref:PiggyBac transposable element-derived protein domain-containing protein n=1 Tax=Cordylochernes scorpioides TaxID=51811 RepID=A0ABY6L8J0_9ARAC|nr:hypothetical protein LAZ67_15001134 [Cordylochernes scorpioides]